MVNGTSLVLVFAQSGERKVYGSRLIVKSTQVPQEPCGKAHGEAPSAFRLYGVMPPAIILSGIRASIRRTYDFQEDL